MDTDLHGQEHGGEWLQAEHVVENESRCGVVGAVVEGRNLLVGGGVGRRVCVLHLTVPLLEPVLEVLPPGLVQRADGPAQVAVVGGLERKNAEIC